MKKEKLFNITVKNIISCILIIFLCSIIGSLLLAIVYSIPLDSITKNVSESAIVLSNEGMYPHLFEWCTSRLDNSTDSIMLLESCCDIEESIINKIMIVYRGSINGDAQYWSLLDRFVNNINYEGYEGYARYWHGYLVTLKPLLTIFTYQQIRILNLIIQTLLTFIIFFILYKNDLKKYIIPYIICLLMINPICIAYSLQFSTCFYIFSLTSIAVLLSKSDKKWIIFLLSGIATAYFDFLTYPIVTLGIPLVFYVITNNRDGKSLLLSIVNICIAWGLGYSLMWANKWLLADILTNSGVIKNALEQVTLRTTGEIITDAEKVTRFDAIRNNFDKFFNTPFKYLLVISIFISLFMIIKNKKRINIGKIIIFLLIGLLPIVWYFVVYNHSIIHNYFTNKALITTIFSILASLAYLS